MKNEKTSKRCGACAGKGWVYLRRKLCRARAQATAYREAGPCQRLAGRTGYCGAHGANRGVKTFRY